MGREFELALFRDAAARNRLEGKSGALLDSFANDIEAGERAKERREQESRQDGAHQEVLRAQHAVLDEQRQLRWFLEAQAEANQRQIEAENQAFQGRKNAKVTLERKVIPEISARIDSLEDGAPIDYFDLVELWHDLRVADNLYEKIDWTFLELQGPLADFRARAKKLVTRFKDRRSPDTYLECLNTLLHAAAAVDEGHDFYWDLDEPSFSSPLDPVGVVKSWVATTSQIENYANALHELVTAAAVAKELGVIAYQDDRETFVFGNVAWFHSTFAAFATSASCPASIKGEQGINNLLWYLYIARSPESVGDHLAGIYDKRNAKYAAVLGELHAQAQLIASLETTPDSIEPALRKRPLRFVGIELLAEMPPPPPPSSLFGKFMGRISGEAEAWEQKSRIAWASARKEKARILAEVAGRAAEHMKQTFESHLGWRPPDARRTRDSIAAPADAASVAASNGMPASASKSTDLQWEALLRAAASDYNTGRELISMLGAMYQQKRRNPPEQLTLPKLVTSLPNDQQALKRQLTALFEMTKNEDTAKLSTRSHEIQRAREAAGHLGEERQKRARELGS